MARIIENEKEAEKLQEEIDGIAKSARCWAMKFNVEKCKVIHVGNKLNRATKT